MDEQIGENESVRAMSIGCIEFPAIGLCGVHHFQVYGIVEVLYAAGIGITAEPLQCEAVNAILLHP